MENIKKVLVPWEIEYSQIQFTGREYSEAMKLFHNYLGKAFETETFMRVFSKRNFLHEPNNK